MTKSKMPHTDANTVTAADSETTANCSPADQDQVNAVDRALADAVSDEPGDAGFQTQVQSLQADLAAAEERVLRAHAELENYRKRASRHLDEAVKYASLPLLRDLLPIVDNLERAIQSADQEGGSARLVEGVKMVAQALTTVLERHHCRRIESQGAVFDPHVHEAIAQFPNEQVPPGTVIEVAQNGYQLYDRVVRPSQVVVSARPAAASPTGNETKEHGHAHL